MNSGPNIPGQTPLDDSSGLKVRGVRTREELNPLEAENIRKAMMRYLAAKPSRKSARFTVEWALGLHKEMLGEIWEWAGRPRKSDKTIGCPWSQVEIELRALFDDLAEWVKNGMPLEEQAVRLHHRAVRIHPFNDGNGRWSRLLANIWLKLNGAEPIDWPVEIHGAESVIRARYLEALKAADGFDLIPLTNLHAEFR